MLLSTAAGKPTVCFAAGCVRHLTAQSLAEREGTGVGVVGGGGGGEGSNLAARISDITSAANPPTPASF